MPRAGGEADKLGNRYELAWAVRHALLCLRNDESHLIVEEVDPDLGRGAEFTFLSRHSAPAVHQVKRQFGSRSFWTVGALADRGVFDAAREHVAAGREYHFSSLLPSGALRELADRARSSESLDEFETHSLTDELRRCFADITDPRVLGDPITAWRTLRGMRFAVREEDETIRINGVLAEHFLEGATGPLMALALGAVLLDNLGVRLNRQTLLQQLAPYEIVGLSVADYASAGVEVSAATRRWLNTVQRELLDPPIDRSETDELLRIAPSAEVVLLTGSAGGGKSSVALQVVERLQRDGASVLAFRLDRLAAFATTTELGRQLELSMSPAAVLALAKGSQPAYLVVDQLDAVSLASGRMSERFDVIADLISEATSHGGIKVILVCRKFDIDNDHRIRKLDARDDVHSLAVDQLPASAVTTAVQGMGLDAERLTPTQVALLRTPLHLVLLKGIASTPDALSFSSTDALFEAFWERKRQQARMRRDGLRFNDVLSIVANAASDQQRLWVPIELLDADELIDDANVLISEQVLTRDGQRVAFFHESFFDYAFARQWMTRQESMTSFLTAGEQELFRRAQVRQVLHLLHAKDPEGFRAEVGAMLSSHDVRFHVKDVVVAVLGNLAEPATEDALLVIRLMSTKPRYEERVWLQLTRSGWFARFNELGVIAEWLASDDAKTRDRAISYMAAGLSTHSDDVLTLLEQIGDPSGQLAALRWLAQVTDLHDHRQLFDVVLAAVARGQFEGHDQSLWLATHDLAKHQPLWAVELLAARFVANPAALNLAPSGEVAALKVRDYGGTELVRDAAGAEPLAFAEVFVPFLLDVMAATQAPQHLDNLITDRHFAYRFASHRDSDSEFDDAVFFACVTALEDLAKSEPGRVRPLLDRLAESPYDAAQYLLYRALTAGADTFWPWSADLLLEGGTRLDCGYVSDSHWGARELLRSTAPLVDEPTHLRLELLVRDLRVPYESRQSFGHTAFVFLTALDEERLSPTGTRRLGEHRRKFGRESPTPPRGIEMWEVTSPIRPDATKRMSDDQWLRAISKHDADDAENFRERGGARELSHALKNCVQEDPRRFARLALKIEAHANPVYAGAILWGFGEASPNDEDAELIFDAVRHLVTIGGEETDRWLGYGLRHLYDQVPIDLVEVVLDRALNAPDPSSNRPIFTRDGNQRRSEDLYQDGINTSRGHLAESLGDLLIRDDADGTRTSLVTPHLLALASDPILCVRACVAHTIAACLKHARPSAYAAFDTLVNADDFLLASHHVTDLMLYIGNVNPEHVSPVIERMLRSDSPETRRSGGSLAAYAGLQWDVRSLLDSALSGDSKTRQGAAQVCSARIDRPTNLPLLTDTLEILMHDADPDVRAVVGEVAGRLRSKDLTPFSDLLTSLIASPSYDDANPQLLITLQQAVTRVDHLVLHAAQRFLAVFGDDAADIRTGAAGDARYISELVIRGLAQSTDATHRAALLDVLDRLLEMGVYWLTDALSESDRR